MKRGKKYHWYLLTYLTTTEITWGMTTIYIGNEKQKITRGDANRHKITAGLDESAVMTSCSYMGYMTNIEFEDEENEDGNT